MVGGEIRAGGDAAGGIDRLSEVYPGDGVPGLLPVEGPDLRAPPLRRRAHAQVLGVEVAVDQRGRETGAGAREPIPVLVELIEPRDQAVEKRHVVRAERGIVDLSSNQLPRRAHRRAVAARSRIGQAGLVGGGPRRGVQDPKPPGGRGAAWGVAATTGGGFVCGTTLPRWTVRNAGQRASVVER